MLTFKFHIAPSLIPFAGKGLFTVGPLKKSQVIIVPNQQHILYKAEEMKQFSTDSIEHASSVRWFEDVHTVDPE